jgi:hypothetical protein
MDIATTISLVALGLFILFGLGILGLYSIREGERRAARLALGAAVVFSLPLLLASLLPVGAKLTILGVIVAAGVLGTVLFLLPIGRVERGGDVPRGRFDERDIMFARARLVPGSPEYEAYYKMRPGNPNTKPTTRCGPKTRLAMTKRASSQACSPSTPEKRFRWPSPRPRPAFR